MNATNILILLSFFYLTLLKASFEIDVVWNFDRGQNDTAGWGDASAAESNIVVSIADNALVCSVIGNTPVLDSPGMFLTITDRHFVIIRMKYLGASTSFNLLLRSGVQPSKPYNMLFNTQHWTKRQPITAISDSGSKLNHGSAKAFDNDPYTSFNATTNKLAHIIFDLGDYRHIVGLTMQAIGGPDSPKRCILQKSITSGIGPFVTVIEFVGLPSLSITRETLEGDVNSTIPIQTVQPFDGIARYWKLIIVDNYGGENIGIREFQLNGYDETVTVVPFNVDNTGVYKTYHLPIHTYLSGKLLRMRLAPQYPISVSDNIRESFVIDWINIARAPLIYQVLGCLDKYYATTNLEDPQYNVTTHINRINNNLPVYHFTKNALNLKYSTTYNCPVKGNVTLAIQGINFGDMASVYVNNKTCKITGNVYDKSDGRLQTLFCTLPPATGVVKTDINNPENIASNYTPSIVGVRVQNFAHPGMSNEIYSLQYSVAPPVPDQPVVTNIGANKVDLIWKPPGNVFDQMTVTGYKIMWFQPKFRSMPSNCTVGNVTVTSIRGLQPGTEYVFAIAAVNEGIGNANLETDLYGRRDHLPSAMMSAFSLYTNISATLPFDFDFNFFNANATHNASTATKLSHLGPTGQFGGDGNYGLVLVGSANVQNCNVSSTCCDGYNATIGLSSCGTLPSVCAVLPARMLAYDYVIGGITRRSVTSNLPYSNGAPPEIAIITLDELRANKGADLPNIACGPALRLTASSARQSGSSWYRRKVNVREGFDTRIKFQISNPSQKCDRLDDVNTYCRSRGADGFAFVLQNEAPDALGNAGSGLGYEGIFNALAVEMDTYHNYDQMDYYENHISVMTQGFRFNITANHSRSLATTNRIPDLTDGIHTVRIKYDPNFDANAVPHPSFQVNGFTTWFMNNADFTNGGEGDWGTGFGLLYVYLDDMYSPVITTPLNLGKTLKLDNGRAYVGLTAATGDQYWQAHDIHSWQFSSLYIDEKYTPPMNINDEGAYKCVNETTCVNRVDYDHYMRTNNVWGPAADSTEGWQSGEQGYCAFC